MRGRPGKKKGLTRAGEPNHVDQDTRDVGGISSAKGVVSHPDVMGGIHSPEIYPVRVPVPGVLSRLVQIDYVIMSLANQIIFRDLTTSQAGPVHLAVSADRTVDSFEGGLTITPAMELRKTEYADR